MPTNYIRATEDITVPDYDWQAALGKLPERTLRQGQTNNTHPLTRALGDPTLRPRALAVLREAIIAAEGRNQVLGALLGVHPLVASRFVSRNGLSDLAADQRAHHGHAGITGFGKAPTGGRKKRPSKRRATHG